LPGKNSSEDVSIGKQVYQLRDGFLLSKIPVSTSIGERAALYLGPLQTLQSKDIGQEVTLTTFYYIGKQHFVQGIAYVAFREKRLKRRWKEAQRTGIPYRPRGLCFLASTIDDRSFSVA
jgi:hypothetical protein